MSDHSALRARLLEACPRCHGAGTIGGSGTDPKTGAEWSTHSDCPCCQWVREAIAALSPPANRVDHGGLVHEADRAAAALAPPRGDRDATCAWDCELPYPHQGPCSSASNPAPLLDQVRAFVDVRPDDSVMGECVGGFLPAAAPAPEGLDGETLRALADLVETLMLVHQETEKVAGKPLDGSCWRRYAEAVGKAVWLRASPAPLSDETLRELAVEHCGTIRRLGGHSEHCSSCADLVRMARAVLARQQAGDLPRVPQQADTTP